MKLIPLLALLFIFSVSLNAQELVQNKSDSSIDFKIKNLGVHVKGTFTEVAISSNFNTDSLEGSYINATIKVNSINTKNKKRDIHLLKDDFFDAVKYPDIKLISTKIEKVSDKNYKLFAKLSIKNKTKSVEIPLDIQDDDKSITIRSNFDLNRRDYDVGGRSWILSNTVKINVVHKLCK